MGTDHFNRFEFFLGVLDKKGKDIDVIVDILKMDSEDGYNLDPSFFERYFRKDLLLSITNHSRSTEVARELLNGLENVYKAISYPIYPQLEALEMEVRDPEEFGKVYSLCQLLLDKENLISFYNDAKAFLSDHVSSRLTNEISVGGDAANSHQIIEWTGDPKVFFALMSVLTETNDKGEALLKLHGDNSNKSKTRDAISRVFKVPKETDSQDYHTPLTLAQNCNPNASYFRSSEVRSDLKLKIKDFISNLS